jgi:hypothetical protein
MKKLPVIFLFAAALAGAQQKQQPAEASPALPSAPFDMEVEAGAGWDLLFNDAFASFLAANGMTAIEPARTWRTAWRFAYTLKSFYVAVGSSRTTNFIFGPYGDPQRTRLVWDSTDLTLGLMAVNTDTVTWSLGAGIGVSKLLLQAYTNAPATFDAAYAAAGTIDLVTSWNWTPLAETLIAVRVWRPGDAFGLWLMLGVQAGWLPFASTWKLFDDPAVSGVPKPFDFFVRPALWVEIR